MNKAILEAMNKFVLDADVQEAMNWGKERNIFSVVGLGETRHSKMIAWLCNPNEGHLQGDYFIKALLREVFSQRENVKNTLFDSWDASDIEGCSFNAAVTFTELVIADDKDRKIDVAIIDPVNEVAVFIENKTGSGEGLDQTPDYFTGLSQTYENFYQVFVFMDMYKETAKDEGNWVNVSYDWLVQALDSLIKKGVLDAEVEVILAQYLDSLNEDESENPFFKSAYELLSKVAQKHKGFLKQLKSEVQNNVTRTETFDEQKVWWLYKKHEIFFESLFSYCGFEYWVEEASKKFGFTLEQDFKKVRYYMYSEEWKKYYSDTEELWGIQFFAKEGADDSDDSNGKTNYLLNTHILTGSFENPEAAIDAAKELNRDYKGRINLVFEPKRVECEENMVDEIVDSVKFIEGFFRLYEEKKKLNS